MYLLPILLLLGQAVTVDGKYPQLPNTLGTNGGLKVECWNGTVFGNCVGGGGGGGTVDQGLAGVSPWLITFGGTAQPVSQSAAPWSVTFPSAQSVNVTTTVGLTDTELRASAVSVSDTMINTVRYPFGSISFSENWLLGVGGRDTSAGDYWPIPLSNSGTKVAISATVLPLPTGAATEASLSSIEQSSVLYDDAASGKMLVVGGLDNTGIDVSRALILTSSTPAGTEKGLITRNIPSGTQPVSLAAFPDNEPFNVAQIGGTNTVTGGLAGTLGVGGTAANDAAINQNPLLISAETVAQGTSPTAATAGNQRRILATTQGVQYVQEGSSFKFSCFVQAVTATTQCQAAPAAGLRAYITSVTISNLVATVQGVDIVYGTGANCATGITALTHKFQMGTNALTTSPFVVTVTFPTPLVPNAATAICLRPTAATSFGATITGFIGS